MLKQLWQWLQKSFRLVIAIWLVGWGKYLIQGSIDINRHTLLSITLVFIATRAIRKIKDWVITIIICGLLMVGSALSDYYKNTQAVRELEELLALLFIVMIALYIFFGMKTPKVTQVILQRKILQKLQDKS